MLDALLQAGHFAGRKTVRRKAVGLALADLLTADHAPGVQRVTVVAAHVDKAPAGIVELLALLQQGLDRSVGPHRDRLACG